jgi:hypothetical protein
MRAHATLRLESSGKASQQRGLWTVLHVTDVSLVLLIMSRPSLESKTMDDEPLLNANEKPRPSCRLVRHATLRDCAVAPPTAYVKQPLPARPMPGPPWQSLRRFLDGQEEVWRRFIPALLIDDV